MSRLLAVTGMLISIAYLWFVYTIVGNPVPQLRCLELNELGDFFAGVFGPLAILWLVLGFFQQGMELRQNNRALELQAEELRNSVVQQRELVSVARDQVKADIESAHMAKEQAEAAMRPVLVSTGGGGSHSGKNHKLSLALVNLGAPVSGVRLSFSGDFEKYKSSMAILDKGGRVQVDLDLFGERAELEGCEDVLSVSYLKSNGVPDVNYFMVKIVYNTELPSLNVLSINQAT